jgi:hypothetical protein
MPALILIHNIDVMHQERNMGEHIIDTCMGFSSKTKDNMKARQDLTELCNHSSLELKVNGGKPIALFCFKPQQRKEVMRWIKRLKFPAVCYCSTWDRVPLMRCSVTNVWATNPCVNDPMSEGSASEDRFPLCVALLHVPPPRPQLLT